MRICGSDRDDVDVPAVLAGCTKCPDKPGTEVQLPQLGTKIHLWTPGTEVQLPTLNVEDADLDDSGRESCGQGSRRPSKLTLESADETAVPLISNSNAAEIAALTVQQLEPEVSDVQLAEVRSHEYL